MKYLWFLFCLGVILSCKLIQQPSKDSQVWIDTQTDLWNNKTSFFMEKNSFSNTNSIKNYIKKSSNTESKFEKSIRHKILDLVQKNYRNKIFDSPFFIIENITQHGIFYNILVDCEKDNWMKIKIIKGELFVSDREAYSFSEYDHIYKKCKDVDYYKYSTNLKKNTIINKFSGDNISIKIVLEPNK